MTIGTGIVIGVIILVFGFVILPIIFVGKLFKQIWKEITKDE